MTKTEQLAVLVDQASNKNPLMAAGIIKQAAGLSADILADHERRLDTAAGAVGQLAGRANNQAENLDALTKATTALENALAARLNDIEANIQRVSRVVAELAARSGMAGHFAYSMEPGAIVEGEYSRG